MGNEIDNKTLASLLVVNIVLTVCAAFFAMTDETCPVKLSCIPDTHYEYKHISYRSCEETDDGALFAYAINGKTDILSESETCEENILKTVTCMPSIK